MKLIDLLVQELPKRGGWPDFAVSIHQDHDGEIYAWTGSSCKLLFRTGIIADNCRPYGLDESIENMVTRNQYKSAIALSQKPAWNGEGLPPVGCECEYQYKVHGSGWCRFECVAVDGKAIFGWSNNTPVALQLNTHNFRPLRTEAERKRDEAISEIGKASQLISNNKEQIKHIAKHIYDAIAAGKIPGVKLDD